MLINFLSCKDGRAVRKTKNALKASERVRKDTWPGGGGSPLQTRGLIPMFSSSTQHSQGGCTDTQSCDFRLNSRKKTANATWSTWQRDDCATRVKPHRHSSVVSTLFWHQLVPKQRKNKWKCIITKHTAIRRWYIFIFRCRQANCKDLEDFFKFSWHLEVLYMQYIICWCCKFTLLLKWISIQFAPCKKDSCWSFSHTCMSCLHCSVSDELYTHRRPQADLQCPLCASAGSRDNEGMPCMDLNWNARSAGSLQRSPCSAATGFTSECVVCSISCN